MYNKIFQLYHVVLLRFFDVLVCLLLFSMTVSSFSASESESSTPDLHYGRAAKREVDSMSCWTENDAAVRTTLVVTLQIFLV